LDKEKLAKIPKIDLARFTPLLILKTELAIKF